MASAAPIFVHPSRRVQGKHSRRQITVPSSAIEADPESRLGELAAEWQRRMENGTPGLRRHQQLTDRLQACELLIHRATVDSDMDQIARATVAIPILKRTIEGEKSAWLSDQEAVEAAKARMDEAWDRLRSLLSAWEGGEVARNGAGHALSDDEVIVELGSLLGRTAVPFADESRQRLEQDRRHAVSNR